MDGVLVKTDIYACFLLFNFVKHKQNKVNKKYSHCFLMFLVSRNRLVI